MPFSSRQSLLWLTAVVQGCCCCGTCAAPAKVWLGPKRERLAVKPGRENRLKCEGQQSFLNRGRNGTGFHPLQLAFAPGRSCSDSAPGAPEGQTCYSQTALPRHAQGQRAAAFAMSQNFNPSKPCNSHSGNVGCLLQWMRIVSPSKITAASPTHWDNHAGLKGCSSGAGRPRVCDWPPAAAEPVCVR